MLGVKKGNFFLGGVGGKKKARLASAIVTGIKTDLSRCYRYTIVERSAVGNQCVWS